jgi:uncharacterized zinc-type alcohol dehydrogenase-like protein
MSINVVGYAANSPDADLTPYRFDRRDPRPDDVVIEILYCGVCHSDLHTARNDWGWTRYPIVPGHEIIGRVTEIGSQVTKFRVGDRVGVGCLVDSCRECPECQHGHEQYCDSAVYTYGGADRHDHRPTQGGYSSKIVVSDAFVLRIPDGLDLKGAAPLLCAIGTYRTAAASASSAWAASVTWRSNWPRVLARRSRCSPARPARNRMPDASAPTASCCRPILTTWPRSRAGSI